MNLLMMTIMFLLSVMMFSLVNTPLNMTIILLIKTLLTALFICMINSNSWFPLILFLIFLGGMMILFIYIATLAPNEMFSPNYKKLISTIITTSLIFIYIKPLFLMPINLINLNVSNQLINLYSSPSMKLTLVLMGFLLLTLIVVIKISNIMKGPLRFL
uniref:NADH-ubiquinone oxidoreductase chain 6 n=1 Tax=Myrmecophilus manni TaxID=270849 RepID=B6DE97_9ORTH|nr:NADH dehydrogenase subunit 6 [Myrmecophilus manni]ACG59293.1 NADH dehydrogenase subunit 6 [Myrmecophilus manni]